MKKTRENEEMKCSNDGLPTTELLKTWTTNNIKYNMHAMRSIFRLLIE